MLGRNFDITNGRVACEVYSATWNLGTNSAFALGSRKTTENLHRVGDCMYIGPLPSTGHGAVHKENTPSVVSYNYSAPTTAENTASLLCDVTAYARTCSTCLA
jgi:hypothetical protein